MVRDRRDDKTMSLLDWQPPEVAVKVADHIAGQGDLANRIAKSVSHALRECELDRDRIALEMSRYLGRKVSHDVLDKWSSEASEANRIPFDAMIALIDVTGCTDLLGFAPEIFGFVVVENRYRKIIELYEIERHERQVKLHEDQLRIRKAGLLEQMGGDR